MNTPKDDHSVTSSPLMCLEFIIIQTIIWGFLLPVLAYALELFLIMPLSNYLRSLSLFIPGLYYVLKLFACGVSSNKDRGILCQRSFRCLGVPQTLSDFSR